MLRVKRRIRPTVRERSGPNAIGALANGRASAPTTQLKKFFTAPVTFLRCKVTYKRRPKTEAQASPNLFKEKTPCYADRKQREGSCLLSSS